MNEGSHPSSQTPDNQMQMHLPGLGQEGYELMEKARRWVGRHFMEWCYFKKMAREATSLKGYARANWCIEAMRDETKCKVPNAYAPCFARIAMEEEPHGIKFKCGRSKADGFTTAVLH